MSNYGMKIFSAKKMAKKGAVEGGSAGGVAGVLVWIFSLVKANNPDLNVPPNVEAAVIGVLSMAITGGWKCFRNWLKNR